MSWDLFVLDLPADAETIEAIPPDFVPRPLGPRAEIIAARSSRRDDRGEIIAPR